MPHSSIFGVEIVRVTGIEIVQDGTQITPRGFQKQIIALCWAQHKKLLDTQLAMAFPGFEIIKNNHSCQFCGSDTFFQEVN